MNVLLDTHWNFSILHGSDRARSDPCIPVHPVGTSCSSIELDQVLEDQLTPAIAARLDQQSAFSEPTKLDRRKAEIFCKRTNFRRRV
ncbi:hypothetical protein J2046_002855 [Rhizobium petrolearium]|nr:hypothetical protein [Neorhizobium petrolearium]